MYRSPIIKTAFPNCCGADIISNFLYASTYYDQNSGRTMKNPFTLSEEIRLARDFSIFPSNKGVTLAILSGGQRPVYEAELFRAGFVILIPEFYNSNTGHALTLYGYIRNKTVKGDGSRTESERKEIRKFILDTSSY